MGFVCKGKDDALVTKNMAPGESVYGEKRISAEHEEQKVEYRVWNPFRSKLGATIVGGIGHMPIKPGSKVLYLGGASGTTVSHVSDMIGPEGVVYAVEFSHRPGRELTNMAKKRPNVVPIVDDARRHGRRDLQRCRAAGPGPHCRVERAHVLEERRLVHRVDQGELR